jgi:general secretion pathway protein K
MSSSVRPPGDSERGFALVMVLWMGLLIAVIGGSLLHEVRSERVSAATDAAELEATLLADGGINRAILSLIDQSDSIHWHIDGTPQTLQVAGHDDVVRVESEAGKIDLNAAPASLLAALLRGAGTSAADSQTLADRVIAWRSPVPSGAIDATTNLYRDAGRSYGPRHEAFRSVGELRMVLGMTDELQSALVPLVTVYSNRPAVDRGVAGDAVLLALQAAGDNFAAAQMSARASGQAAGVDRAPSEGEALTISARVEVKGALADRHAVVRINADANSLYKVLEWK